MSPRVKSVRRSARVDILPVVLSYSMTKETTMSKQATVKKRGEVTPLQVLGSEIRFLCEGERTNHVWSLMECAVPRDVGPPPHHHAWDEAYYIIEGQVKFTLEGRE